MTGRTHDLAAFTTLTYLVLSHPLPHITLATGLVAITANLVGGIAPDIDQPTAPFWRNLPIGHVLGRLVDPVLGGHRFLSHSLVGMGIFGLGFHFMLEVLKPSFPHLDMNLIWWAFMIGFLSHLVMDSITREGVPWLLPIPIKFALPPVKAFRVQTGGLIENYVIIPLLILTNVYLYYVNYERLVGFIHHFTK